MAEGRADLGPVMPSRCAVYAQARELRELAARAEELSRDSSASAGCRAEPNLALALLQFERMRAVLGPDVRAGIEPAGAPVTDAVRIGPAAPGAAPRNPAAALPLSGEVHG